MDKSPFLIVNNYVSPMKCDELRNLVDFIVPDVDANNNPRCKKIDTLGNIDLQTFVRQVQDDIADKILHHFNQSCNHKSKFATIEWYPTGYKEKSYKCENSEYAREKWVKVRDNDFTAVIMLNDTADTPPIDDDYEVYGGKFEFPQHGFGFNAKLGTLIVYPSDPHFINGVAPVALGNLKMVKIYFTADSLYLYQPSEYTGDFTTWFK